MVPDSLRPHGLQAPLSMRFSRQGHWSGLPFHPPTLSRVSPSSNMTVVLTKRGNLDTDTYTVTAPCEDWSHCHEPGNYQKLGERPGTCPSLEPLRQRCPEDILFSDFWPQNNETINSCCLSHPVCGTPVTGILAD